MGAYQKIIGALCFVLKLNILSKWQKGTNKKFCQYPNKAFLYCWVSIVSNKYLNRKNKGHKEVFNALKNEIHFYAFFFLNKFIFQNNEVV